MASNKKANFGRLLKLALTYDSNPNKVTYFIIPFLREQEDFFNIIHWMRQIIAIILGCVAGILHLTGFPIIAGYIFNMKKIYLFMNSFFIINFGIFHLYSSKYVNFEDESVEQHEVYTEALGLGFATFMVTF